MCKPDCCTDSSSGGGGVAVLAVAGLVGLALAYEIIVRVIAVIEEILFIAAIVGGVTVAAMTAGVVWMIVRKAPGRPVFTHTYRAEVTQPQYRSLPRPTDRRALPAVQDRDGVYVTQQLDPTEYLPVARSTSGRRP